MTAQKTLPADAGDDAEGLPVEQRQPFTRAELAARIKQREQEDRDDLQRAVELTCHAALYHDKPGEGVEEMGRLLVSDIFESELDGFYGIWDKIVGTEMTEKQLEAVIEMVDSAFWYGLTHAHTRVTHEAGLSYRLFPGYVGVSGL